MPEGALPEGLVLGGWDLALMGVVTLQGGVLAYLRAPRWKALALSLPWLADLG